MGFDTSYYYRLTNNFLGATQALDVNPNGSCLLMMAGTADQSGQYWKLVDLGKGKYALRTWYLGDDFSLDIINDGTNTTPRMAPTGHYTGQSWTLTPWGDGTYKLTNDFTGPDKSLDVKGDTHAPFLDTGDHTGQHWTLAQATRIPSPVDIPPLNSKGSVYSGEGPTDFTFYAKPSGTVKAVMVFVDFSNAPAGSTSASDTAKHLLDDGNAQKLYRDQSYGQLTLDVTVLSALGWKRMPNPSTQYSFATFDTHKHYITDAAALFDQTEVNFSDYTFVFIVAPQNAGFPLSPAFNAAVGSGAPSPSGEIRLAVTFGTDSYTNRYINLVHEVGHLFGLPDLYPYSGNAGNSQVGCWAIMSDIFHSVSFLGWHRHKNGWLAAPRKTYVNSTVRTFYTISPLADAFGLSMIVLPIDDAKNPSKVFVIELAQPVLGTNNQRWGDGVLLYTVDATIPTGSSPVVVIPKQASTSPDYGYLYQAPYGVHDVASNTDGTTSIKVSVLQKFASSYNVQIDYTRQ